MWCHAELTRHECKEFNRNIPRGFTEGTGRIGYMRRPLSMNRNRVAQTSGQTSGLLYRRLPACSRRASSRAPALRASADCKSAIQQTGGLRYDTCAGWFMVRKREPGAPTVGCGGQPSATLCAYGPSGKVSTHCVFVSTSTVFLCQINTDTVLSKRHGPFYMNWVSIWRLDHCI